MTILVVCLSFAVATLDQVAKLVIRRRFLLGDGLTVIPGLFDLRYVQNTGAAWGILPGLNDWLVALSLAVLVLIAVWHRHLAADGRACRLAAGLLVGGVTGNLLDRIRYGYVVDFLDFYLGRRHFPAFNVADAAICTGVGLYMLLQFLDSQAPAAAAPRGPADGGGGGADPLHPPGAVPRTAP